MVMAFNNEFLSKFFLQIDEQVHRINRLFLLKESVTCKDQAFLYSDIAAQIHSLQALVNKIKVILEHEKQSLAQAQVYQVTSIFIVFRVDLEFYNIINVQLRRKCA